MERFFQEPQSDPGVDASLSAARMDAARKEAQIQAAEDNGSNTRVTAGVG